MATNKDVIAVYLKYSRPYLGRAILILTAIVLAVGAEAIAPWYFGAFVDGLARSVPGAAGLVTILQILTVIIILRIVSWACWRISGFLTVDFQPRVIADMNRASFSYLLDHSYQFFTNSFVGSLVRKVNRLTRSFETIDDELQFRIVPVVVTMIGGTIGLGLKFPIIALVFFGWTILFIVGNYLATLWKLQIDVLRAKKDSEASGAMADALTNSVTIKLFSGKNYENSRYDRIMHEWRTLQTRGWRRGEIIFSFQGVMMLALEIGLLWYGAVLWSRGVLTAGDFVLIQGYLVAAFRQLWDIGRGMRYIFEGLIDAKEMVEILQLPHEVQDKHTAGKLIAPQGGIEFVDVDFYFHKTRPVFKQFFLSIPPKQKIALVGPSGAGKTTITKLLFRFYDVTAGEILVDGQNIASVTQESLRQSLALVPQEPILFHRPLMENIRYGRLGATDAEVIEAAKKARCHEFIMDAPQGYDTYVGERGVKLSGGERQRIAIARAILKNAPILVLDEATSSLDSESERLIQEALAELMKDKTAIVIAHRLSTIMKMDRIVVIEQGKVAASGTHQELLAAGGTYRTLWDIQVGGFLGGEENEDRPPEDEA